MSIIKMQRWASSKLKQDRQYEPRPYRMPEEMMGELDHALEEQRHRPPLGVPAARSRTAQIISDEINHLQHELAGARELVKAGEAKEAALVAELTRTVDEEIAAKKATHEADVAELESLRPATGETS